MSYKRNPSILKPTINHIPRRNFLKMIGACAAATVVPACTTVGKKERSDQAKKPNILFFLVDDMGWMDSTVYGSKYYHTPNMERLASRGMRFTDAYAANPLCSPTRASILTGRHPSRFGITGASGHLPPQDDIPLLGTKAAAWRKMVCPRSRRYMPLEEYTIGEAFKEAGYDTAFIGKWHLGFEPWWPEKQGFDFTLASGQYPGPPSYHSPYGIHSLENGPDGEYLTDRLTDEALKYLEQSRENPFLLCMWHYAVHAPYQGKESIVEKYRDKVDPRGKQESQIMAAMIESMDESLGRILDKLDVLKLSEDTIIIFMSDNGGVDFSETAEGNTPTSNYPLRKGKATIYEGGTREPCMIVWPGVVRGGSTCNEVISSIDFFPTMLEMASIQPERKLDIDGLSIVPLLRETGTLKREQIFCHFPHYVLATKNLPGTYVRQGHWKLIRFYGEGPDRTFGYELYNLKDDISETTNLAEKMPEKVKQLDALITGHLKETGGIIPIKNPDYNPRLFNPITDKPIAGWIPSPDCTISPKNGMMHVSSVGKDPFLHTNEVPETQGNLILKLRMKSTGKGNGQIYWGTKSAIHFHGSRSVVFTMKHDNQWQDYSIDLPVDGCLHSLRLDTGQGAGEIVIESLRLVKPDGMEVKTWDFKTT